MITSAPETVAVSSIFLESSADAYVMNGPVDTTKWKYPVIVVCLESYTLYTIREYPGDV